MTADRPASQLPAARLHEVQLLKVPIPVHAQAQEHGAELMREMYLMAQQLKQGGSEHVPVRLVALVDALGTQFAGLTTDQDLRIEAAIDADLDEIDLTYRLPIEAAAAARELGDLLDEADRFCREGQHLLTLATPDGSVRYRRWYLGEFIGQLGGQPPMAWPDYLAGVESGTRQARTSP